MNKKRIKFAKIEITLGYSEAYLSLGNPSMKILTYILFQQKWEDISRMKDKQKWVCTNKDNIQLLYSTFQNAPFKMHSKSITRGIDELLAKGFIKIKEQGGKVKGHASIYKIVDDYKKWTKGMEPISFRRPYRKRGFCA